MIHSCVFLSSVTLCIVAKWCVLEQKLLLTAYRKSYEKSIGTKINDSMPSILLHSSLNILETVIELEAWFQRTTNKKWPAGNQMVT